MIIIETNNKSNFPKTESNQFLVVELVININQLRLTFVYLCLVFHSGMDLQICT